MSKGKQTYNPCDDCQYSYSKNGQESGMCKICEFTYFKDRKQSEVAREIFEEIDDALESNYNPDVCADYPDPHYYLWLADDIAELKKKYTEES